MLNDLYNYALWVSYDGSPFLGFQKTKEGLSIEECLEKALFTILRHEIKLEAASRTDKGVHALGQVVNFFSSKILDEKKFFHQINSLLPKTIRVHSIKKMEKNFHPTLDTLRKKYIYSLFYGKVLPPFLQKTVWHYPYPFKNFSLMKKEAEKLIGKKDFSAFSNQLYENPIRTLYDVQILSFGTEGLVFHFEGDHFLYKMVRILVGTLANIGSGKLELSIDELFKKNQRIFAGITAPPHGLILQEVIYPSSRDDILI